jgi:Glycosyl transferase family 2
MFFFQDSNGVVPRQLDGRRKTGDPREDLLASELASAAGMRERPASDPITDASDPPDGVPFREISDGMAITPSVSVVLPVMNEAANLPHVFASLPDWIDEIILVDGRSTDDTIAVARRLRPDVKIVLQGGVGKGDALVAGFEACTGDIIVAIDGDGSTDGQEIVRFVGTLMTGADFAKGSRFSSAGRSDDITVIRRYGNKVLNIAVNKLFGTSFSDLCYGYNAFWSRHLDRLDLDSPGFEVETLMSIRAARAGLRIHEVPSHERTRLHGSTNLSAVRDGLRILRLILRERQAIARSAARKPKPFMAPGRLAEEQPGRPQLALTDRPAGRIALGRTALGQSALGRTALGQIALGQIAHGRLGNDDEGYANGRAASQ